MTLVGNVCARHHIVALSSSHFRRIITYCEHEHDRRVVASACVVVVSLRRRVVGSACVSACRGVGLRGRRRVSHVASWRGERICCFSAALRPRPGERAK